MSKYVIDIDGKLARTALETEQEIVEYLVGEGCLNFSIYELVGEYAPVVTKKETKSEEESV